MQRSFEILRILLGMPVYRSVVGDTRDGARVSVHWNCGCVATGAGFEKLTLRTCRRHRAGRVEAQPPLAV